MDGFARFIEQIPQVKQSVPATFPQGYCLGFTFLWILRKGLSILILLMLWPWFRSSVQIILHLAAAAEDTINASQNDILF